MMIATGQQKGKLVSLAAQAGPVLGVLALSVWWISLSTRPVFPSANRESTPPARIPEVAYWGNGPAWALRSDVRIIRSPVLMALPSRMGFSGSLRDKEGGIPAPSSGEAPRVYLLPAPAFEAGNFGETTRNLGNLITEPRESKTPALEKTPIALTGAPASAPPYRVYWQDQPEEFLTDLSLADLAGSPGELPWDAVFYICLEARGWVRSIFAEKPAPAAGFNASLVNKIRGMSFSGPVSEPCRRLVVRYQPPLAVQGN